MPTAKACAFFKIELSCKFWKAMTISHFILVLSRTLLTNNSMGSITYVTFYLPSWGFWKEHYPLCGVTPTKLMYILGGRKWSQVYFYEFNLVNIVLVIPYLTTPFPTLPSLSSLKPPSLLFPLCCILLPSLKIFILCFTKDSVEVTFLLLR